MAPRKFRGRTKPFPVKPHLIKNKPQTPEAIKKLFQPVKNLELDSSSDVSDISDIFENFHTDTYLIPKLGQKVLKKHEADIKTMEKFTSDYKNVMKQVRSDMKLDDVNISIETDEDIIKVLNSPKEPQKLPEAVLKEISEILEDREYLNSTPSTLDEQHEETQQKGSMISYDAESEIWKMLTAHTTKNKFTITPPGYNVYNQDIPHWLDRYPVSWEVLDQSRSKCERWLQEHNDE